MYTTQFNLSPFPQYQQDQFISVTVPDKTSFPFGSSCSAVSVYFKPSSTVANVASVLLIAMTTNQKKTRIKRRANMQIVEVDAVSLSSPSSCLHGLSQEVYGCLDTTMISKLKIASKVVQHVSVIPYLIFFRS